MDSKSDGGKPPSKESRRKESQRLPGSRPGALPELGNKFGTFGGVFTPSLLTILGVIMFMRAGFVVGQSGILGAILILIVAKLITVFTSLSVSAISTNMQVRGGGAYFMISRVLGPEFGGAIGVALTFAQALSVPFYLLGFTEALVNTFTDLKPYFQYIAIGSGALLFLVAYVGAGWAIKAQYFIMAVLVASILVIFGGALVQFSPETFATNWLSDYTAVDAADPSKGNFNFWIIFAIYFPAVTGILAGVNMSGDLKNPGESIPKGTLYALGVSFVVYLVLTILAGGAFDRADLIDKPYQTLKDNALGGFGFLVAAGVVAATLSSALGSYLGAPRILQAVARDDILTFLKPFARGEGDGDEPRRALYLTGALTLAVLLWAGNESEGGALNIVASIITMFFLYTYGMTNLAAFIEAFGRNPSFRPRFRFFHWSTALLGFFGCLGVAILIDAIAAVAAAAILAGLLWYINTRSLETTFGDARRGFVFSSLRKNLLRLTAMEEDTKNWRPTILVFSGNPNSRETLVTYAVWLESGRGIVILANVLTGNIENAPQHRRRALGQLNEFCESKNILAFPVVAIEKDLRQTISLCLQTVSIGPIRPNIVMFGWSTDAQRFADLATYLRIARSLSMSLILIRDRGTSPAPTRKTIDVWWRGQKNGELMVLLAHLLGHNWEWVRSTVRVLRVVDDEAGREPARDALQNLLNAARVQAETVAVVSNGRSFTDLLYETSKNSHCVFLGFEIPEPDKIEQWHASYEKLLRGLPTTLLVSSTGVEDMFA